MGDIAVFTDEDLGYFKWLAANPSGYVLECRRIPSPDYMKAHRVGCWTMNQLQTQAENFMGSCMYACASTLTDLEVWAEVRVGGTIQLCQHCQPMLVPRPSKGGRPTIYKLMSESVAALPEPFTRQEILSWFRRHYPAVNPATVSAHIQFATSNPKDRGAFAHRTPVITRIAHGAYVRYRPPSSAVDESPRVGTRFEASLPAGAAPVQDQFDVVLVGCARSKRDVPGPAAELYTSTPFLQRRAIAQAVGHEWYILSAEHGLVAPDQWLAPYDLNLEDTTSTYRDVWGQWVVTKLVMKTGELHGKSILLLASGTYAHHIVDRLRSGGAQVVQPLSGLRQFEQGAWLSAEVRRLQIDQQSSTDTSPSVSMKLPDRRSIAQALLAFRAANQSQAKSRLGFAQTAEADELLQSSPFAFLVGVVLDEGIRAEWAWQGPFELRKRLGHLDPWRMRHEEDRVRKAVEQRPALHRYVNIMPTALVRAADRVCSRYDGDAGLIWSPGSSTSDVEARLREFYRIGPKKAAMAVELLVSHFGVQLLDLTQSNVAYDIHVRRVFLRAGLVDRDTLSDVTEAARSLWPERPGLLDLPAWLIGRGWCHPRRPDCGACPLSEACPKLTHRNAT